ncbi:hypothetical protein [Thalassospira tepidiphila]|uniref:hypothetical protein n=1 Tax=Thalassospira tepidiphila TaxID=393657 RepID=UPI003AA93706
MSKHDRKITFFGPLGLAICAGMGYVAFKMSISLVPSDADFGTPWIMASVFLAPLVYIYAVKNKYYEMETLEGLSNKEKRRISVRVSRKVRNAWCAMVFNVLSAIFSIQVLAFFSSDIEVFRAAFSIIGALFGVSLFLMGMFFSDSHKVSSFIADISNREADRKRRSEFLKKLSSKDDSDAP